MARTLTVRRTRSYTTPESQQNLSKDEMADGRATNGPQTTNKLAGAVKRTDTYEYTPARSVTVALWRETKHGR